MFDIIQSIDQSAILWIYNWGGTQFLDFIFVFLSYTGTIRLAAIILSIYFFWRPETRKISYVIVGALLLSNFIILILKLAVDRPRPYIWLGVSDIEMLVEASPYTSFPSGHSASAFSTMIVVAWYFRKLIVFGMILATVAAVARVYLLVHYPSDVFAGAIIGIAFSLAFILIFEQFRKERQSKTDKEI
ncbi:phosphatase PAP2 family protein [Methanolapillus millepedarum]|uniref:Phosphatidic acid phosphatase type 2/haloperoxidase domain-containing protein n=1 Tax=Methanolapillus millepedarum TaxID=3028296 RepID=A0AA96ZU17_9EURY|nr:hypothetical protein MsAc7_07510 [Methanosarcinaceae archaeon Ac7]